MTYFNRFKLGFDRTFWIGKVQNSQQEKVYDIAVKSQSAALSKLKPGAMAEEIHKAYSEVIQDAGFEYPFRCGRATGYSFLEKPQIVSGDKTVIKPGMVFAFDGSFHSLKLGKDFATKSDINNIEFIRGDIFDQIFPDEVFDFLICNGVLHHTKDPYSGFLNIIKSILCMI